MSNLDRILELARHGTENAQSQVPAERELKEVPAEAPVAKEAVGEFAEPIYDLIDMHFEGDCEPVFDDLVRYLDGQTISDFVKYFRQNHEIEVDDDGERLDSSIKELEEAQSPAQKAAFAKMLAAKNGGKDDAVEEAKAKPDYADIDGDGDEKETMKKAAKDKKVEENLQKAQEEIDELKEELKEDCSCGHGSDCDCGPDCKCGCNAVTEETVTETPTMDTTQLITLLKNAGLSEEAINKKLNEWANTPEGAAEQEATSHGEPYENFAQSVNISLKKYLDAEDYKVGIKEHTVKEISEAYKKFKGDPINEFDHYRDEEGNEVIATPGKDMPPVPPVPQVEPQEEVTMADIQGFLKIQDLVAKSNGAPTAVAVAPTPGMDVPEQPQPESPLDLKAKVQF